MNTLSITRGVFVFICLFSFCQLSTASEGNPPDISPWQQANINWRQYEGGRLSILADAQPAFMALRPYLPLFEALTGIRIGYQNVEQDEMRHKRKLDLSSGGAIYDVIPIGVTYLGEAYYNGWLEPLDRYLADPALTDAEWYDFADISPNSLILCQKEGHLLSVPFDFSAPIFFYRKDLFEKYQISPPDTYEEIPEIKVRLQAAMEADGLKDIYAFATRTRVGAGLNTWTVIPTIRAYGGQMFDSQWRPRFNSPQAVQALEVYRKMVTGYGSPPDALTLHFYEIRELFRASKLASTILASHFSTKLTVLKNLRSGINGMPFGHREARWHEKHLPGHGLLRLMRLRPIKERPGCLFNGRPLKKPPGS